MEEILKEKRQKIRGKRERGITLIALVITIIVLLILAGVTIVTLTGDNGILSNATRAKEETTVEQEREQVELAYSSASVNKLGDSITSGELQDELNKTVGDGKTRVTGGNVLRITFTDTDNVYNFKQWRCKGI